MSNEEENYVMIQEEYDRIHCEENQGIFGELELDDLFEEKTIDNRSISVKRHGMCKLSIYDNEGLIPHFHIENSDKSFQCCVRLDKPEYFIHGSKTDTLSNTEIMKLIKILQSNVKSKKFKMTVYEYACLMWNQGTSNIKNQISEDMDIPDYTKLNKGE